MRKFLIICLFALILLGCDIEVISDSLDVQEEKVSSEISLSLSNESQGIDDHDQNVLGVKEEKSLYDFSVFLYDTPLTFVEYLYSNQIDIDMKREEDELFYTTLNLNAFFDKYYDIWYSEMNTVYESLLAQLSGNAKRMLEESQASWETDHQLTPYLWQETFDLSKGRGSGDYSMVLSQSINRVRQRTFLLAEYQYWLTGDFNFSYNHAP